MSDAPPSNAGVRFPPPLIYVIPLVAAYFLNKWLSLWLARPEPHWMWLLGVILLLVGTVFEIAGVVTFRRHRTGIIIPIRPATMVVQSGPYRFTRNPMYLGMAISYLGVALLIDTWWAFLLFPLVLVVITQLVIEREERYLASTFGGEYDAYRARVRRWM